MNFIVYDDTDPQAWLEWVRHGRSVLQMPHAAKVKEAKAKLPGDSETQVLKLLEIDGSRSVACGRTRTSYVPANPDVTREWSDEFFDATGLPKWGGTITSSESVKYPARYFFWDRGVQDACLGLGIPFHQTGALLTVYVGMKPADADAVVFYGVPWASTSRTWPSDLVYSRPIRPVLNQADLRLYDFLLSDQSVRRSRCSGRLRQGM